MHGFCSGNILNGVLFFVRSGSLLNMCGEKMNQAILVEALETAVSKWPKTELLYYAVAESTLLSGTSVRMEGKTNDILGFCHGIK